MRRLNSELGSASIEAAALVPVIALFILIAFQMSMLLSDSLANVGGAEEAARRALRAWETENAGRGFSRPCIELMEETRFRSRDASQEVRVVADPICSH